MSTGCPGVRHWEADSVRWLMEFISEGEEGNLSKIYDYTTVEV